MTEALKNKKSNTKSLIEALENKQNPQQTQTISFKSPSGEIFNIPISDKAAIDSASARGYIKQ